MLINCVYMLLPLESSFKLDNLTLHFLSFFKTIVDDFLVGAFQPK